MMQQIMQEKSKSEYCDLTALFLYNVDQCFQMVPEHIFLHWPQNSPKIIYCRIVNKNILC